MSVSAVAKILAKPTEVMGLGSRSPFLRRVNRFWPIGLAMTALLCAANAMGHEPVPSAPQNPFPADAGPETAVVMKKAPVGFQLYYQDLGAFVSQQGETKDRFMARVGAFLAYYTKVRGWEACGMVQPAESGDGWAVRLVTNGSQLGCARIQFDMPGYLASEESIHSHPSAGSAKVSRQDNLLQPKLMCGAYVNKIPHEFSKLDLANGAGYLVTPEKLFRGAQLLFQDGGDVVVVAKLDTAPARPDDASYGIPVAEKGMVLVPLDKVPKVETKVAGRTCKVS